MNVRPAEEAEVGQLAKIWHEGWNDAHAKILLAELARLRTLESFAERLRGGASGRARRRSAGRPRRLRIVKGEEFYQLFVAPRARGSGVAAAVSGNSRAVSV